MRFYDRAFYFIEFSRLLISGFIVIRVIAEHSSLFQADVKKRRHACPAVDIKFTPFIRNVLVHI